MKYLIKGLLIFLTFIILSFVIFYNWAGSASYPEPEYARIIKFSDNACTAKDTFSIMTFNIGYLSGLDNNIPVRTSFETDLNNLHKVVEVVNDLSPDFIGFQEIDFCSHRSHYINQFDSIGAQDGFLAGSMAVNWDKKYVPFPYWPPKTYFGKIFSGQAVLSKFPITANKIIKLPKPASNPFYYNRFYLDRLIQVSDIHITDSLRILIINVHFEAFDKPTREIDSDLLLNYLKNIPGELPFLLIGDFNSRPPYNGVDLNDERTIRSILSSGLVPAIDEKTYQTDPDSYNTYRSDNPTEKIDYIFYDPSRISKINAFVVKEMGNVSDHLPLFMKFIIKN